MDLDEKNLEELKRLSNSYLSISDLAENLQAHYRELSDRFEEQNHRLEDVNIQLSDALQANGRLSTYLTNILESINAGIVVIDSNGKINIFNPAAERLSGISREKAIAHKYEQVFPGDDHAPTLGLLDSKECRVHGEKWFASQPVGYSACRIHDTDGACKGVVEILYDLAAEKKLRETISHVSALAAVGEMAATVAHQIRNPLAGIIGFVDLLKRDLGDSHASADVVAKIDLGARELNRIITVLLDYTRKLQPDFRELDLVDFLDETAKALATEPFGANIRIEYSASIKQLPYRFDPLLLRQAINNLAHNAAQAMEPEGGVLQIRLDKKGSDSLVIEFIDSGTGIDSENAEKLFKPFYTTRAQGIGLGLPMVKKTIDFHNGRITAANAPGGGAVFTIELPC